ncbi:MAG TPA: GNAT family N-acetyltransferase [Stellaceae bacterium]|nr:GNAT family N-acetyltransferase [Stellaceae bacterium]
MMVLRDDWEDRAAWDCFAERHSEARFCHLFSYAAVLQCYGYVPRNICFLKNREIVGVLPATQINTMFSGRKLVSQPFSEYGGLLAEPQLSADDIAEIFSLTIAYSRSTLNIKMIEIHGNHGVPNAWQQNWTVRSTPLHIAVLPLNRPPDELWQKVLNYSARKAINQARGYGLEVVFECDDEIIARHFYPLYLRTMKRLGAPPHKISYFLHCYRAFGDKMIIGWAKRDGEIVAGLLGFSCGNRISIISTVSDRRNWHLRPNDLLHWEFIKRAAETGHAIFDFGSVRYQGQRDFKKKWGCEFVEHENYFVGPGRGGIDSSSKSMQTMAALWARYMPSGLARGVGPMIRRQLAR